MNPEANIKPNYTATVGDLPKHAQLSLHALTGFLALRGSEPIYIKVPGQKCEVNGPLIEDNPEMFEHINIIVKWAFLKNEKKKSANLFFLVPVVKASIIEGNILLITAYSDFSSNSLQPGGTISDYCSILFVK